MRSFLRNITTFIIGLYFLPIIVPGVVIEGGAVTMLTAGIILTILSYILKPILQIISFPFNLITLGLFSIFINAFILYLLTIFVTGVSIVSFVYQSTSIMGFTTPDITLSVLFSFLLSSVILYSITGIINWVYEV